MKPMRVYGTSPLYNYVELIFRSKRLFIGSIIIATLATVFLYFSRANNYTDKTLILLTGTTNTQLMKDLLAEYTQRRNAVEKTVAAYQQKNIYRLEPEPGPASNEYQQALKEMKRLQFDKEFATMQYGLLKDHFKNAPKTI